MSLRRITPQEFNHLTSAPNVQEYKKRYRELATGVYQAIAKASPPRRARSLLITSTKNNRGVITYCPNCEAALTDADVEAERCTQCQMKIEFKDHVKRAVARRRRKENSHK